MFVFESVNCKFYNALFKRLNNMYFVPPFDTATVMAQLVAITWFIHVLDNCKRFWILCMPIVKIRPIYL